jgi:hypothetical protein
MAKVDPPPPDDVMEERRKPKWILDPATVTEKEINHLRQWANAKMKRYEGKMSWEVPDRAIIASGDVEPEEPDIGSVYGFSDLHWIIYRDGNFFSFQLFSKKSSLLKIQYAKV